MTNKNSQLLLLDVPKLEAPIWARGGHPQTLLAHFLPSPVVSDLGEEIILPLGDGDEITIYLKRNSLSTVVSLFHGLSGDVDADYMQRTAAICDELGYSRILVNHRGAGVKKGLASKPYHSGISEDVSKVLEYSQKLFPSAKQLAVGFSMSGSILLNLLTKNRGTTQPDGAIVVNAPINLAKSSRLLHQGLNQIYDKRFVQKLKQHFLEKQQKGEISQKHKLTWQSTIYDFDELFTAPLSGFKNRDDYYTSCSTYKLVHKIDRPTYVLTAATDPFVSPTDYNEARWSPWAQVRIENDGGHLGYLQKNSHQLYKHRWLDQYLKAALSALK